jgi:hypothetical protein
VDGGYANRTFLRRPPERTVVVARLPKNAKLRAYLPPDQRHGARKYGPNQPTPDQFLHDETIPWQTLTVFVAGQLRTLQYKVIDGLCWSRGTQDRPLSLILIKAAERFPARGETGEVRLSPNSIPLPLDGRGMG